MPDPVERVAAALEGRYRVERELGEGGMATVYLADDLKHERKVAIKVLRPELAAVVGAERFLAEIKTTAALQHPNILPLFDSGEADGFLFYVMPYVSGESLQDKLDREKQLRVDDALDLTRKVADALDYAHGEGIVHRDIKPANILISERGEPLVADFGIALAVSQAGGGRITETGLSLGTPHYMSPEQATGDRDVDPRSDVYALGCVLYEMLAGEPPFAAPTAQAVLAKILTERPRRVSEVRETVPPHVGAVLARALEKLPADRFESAQEFVEALDDEGFIYRPPSSRAAQPSGDSVAGPDGERVETRSGPGAWVGRYAPWAIAAGATAFALLPHSVPVGEDGVQRTLFGTLPGQEFQPGPPWVDGLALTPDGSRLLYRGQDPSDGSFILWSRDMSTLGAVPIPGTGRAGGPKVSRDGLRFAFARSGRIGVMPIDGGTPLWLEEAHYPFAWGDDGAIYAVDDGAGTITRWVPGEVTPTEVLPAGSTVGRSLTDVLPGSRAAFLLREASGRSTGMLEVVSFESGEIVDVDIGPVGRARYSETGHVVGLRGDGALIVAPFDPETLEATGPARATGDLVGGSEYAFSTDGTLVYLQSSGGVDDLPLVWVAEDGTEEEIDWIDPGVHDVVSIAPDGRRVAASVDSREGSDIWIYDLEARTQVALTRDDESSRPTWHPDGIHVTYVKTTGGFAQQPADRSGSEEVLLDLPAGIKDGVWTPDGQDFVLRRTEGESTRGIYRLAEGASTDSAFMVRTFNDMNPRPSPDGRWLVYTSDESGDVEIYATPYPDGGPIFPISTQGGSQPTWARDGSDRLFFVDGSDVLQAATVEWDDTSFRVTGTRPLFEMGANSYASDSYRTRWDVAPDGRFLMIRAAGRGEASLVMVRNWNRLLTEAGRR